MRGDETTHRAQALRAKIKARRKGAKGSAAQAETAADAEREAAEIAGREAEAQVQRDAEEQARRDAEEAERRTAQELARRAAEDEARRAAEEQAQREATESARQEAEAQALRKAEERVWRVAEEKARRRREEVARKRARARAAAQEDTSGPGFLRTWGKAMALGLLALLLLGLALLHLISFDSQIPRFEQALAAQFGQPVKIGALRISLLPHTQLRLEDVSIGAEAQISIPRVTASGGLGNLFSDQKRFASLEFDSPRLGAQGVGWLLFGPPPAADIAFERLSATNATLESDILGLPPFAAKLETDGAGAWKTIVIESADQNIGVELTHIGESVQFQFTARSFKLPFGAALTLDDVVAKGIVDRAGLTVAEFKSYAQGGILGGTAALTWDPAWSLAGRLTAQRIDAARLAPGVFDGARVEGTASFAMQAPQGAQLFAAPRLEGTFTMARGTLLGVDLERMMQGGGMRGDTQFTDLSGTFVHENGITRLRQLRLSQGALTATGVAEVDAGRKIRGRLAAELSQFQERRSAQLGIAGTPDKIEWQR